MSEIINCAGLTSEDGNEYIVEIHDDGTVAFLDADSLDVLFTYTIATLAEMAPDTRLSLDLGGNRYLDQVCMWNVRHLAHI